MLTKQLLRSGTAVGALVRETEQAESKADFIHKMAIAQKEANETEYRLELFSETNYLPRNEFLLLVAENSELKKLLASIILISKQTRNR